MQQVKIKDLALPQIATAICAAVAQIRSPARELPDARGTATPPKKDSVNIIFTCKSLSDLKDNYTKQYL